VLALLAYSKEGFVSWKNGLAADSRRILRRHRRRENRQVDEPRSAPAFFGIFFAARRDTSFQVPGGAKGGLFNGRSSLSHSAGLDDGPATIEESICYGGIAIADGITHVVARPHANNDIFFIFRVCGSCAMNCKQKISGRLEIAIGCDFHLNRRISNPAQRSPGTFASTGDFLLVEFKNFRFPLDGSGVHEIQLPGAAGKYQPTQNATEFYEASDA